MLLSEGEWGGWRGLGEDRGGTGGEGLHDETPVLSFCLILWVFIFTPFAFFFRLTRRGLKGRARIMKTEQIETLSEDDGICRDDYVVGVFSPVWVYGGISSSLGILFSPLRL